MYWFVTKESQRKANEYEKLYDSLKSKLKKHKELLKKANEIMDSYLGSVPNLNNSKIPSNYFDPKREEFTEKLSSFISNESEKTASLSTAKDKAKERKDDYVKKVQEEEERERAELVAALKKKAEDLEKLLKGEF